MSGSPMTHTREVWQDPILSIGRRGVFEWELVNSYYAQARKSLAREYAGESSSFCDSVDSLTLYLGQLWLLAPSDDESPLRRNAVDCHWFAEKKAVTGIIN